MHLLTSKICYRALHINCSSQEPAPPCTLRACVSPRKLHPPPRSQEKGQACSPGPGLTCCAVAPRPEHGKQGELQPARRPRAKGLLCYWPSGPWAPPPGSGDKGSPIPGQWGPRRQTVGTRQADSGRSRGAGGLASWAGRQAVLAAGILDTLSTHAHPQTWPEREPPVSG